ncbi:MULTISPECIES: hypothetical protein [Pseudidiomarina]|uniref:DUF1425 domain-containing protein n=2 Tax=Pseudidiomarina TaxID=2800384 RepID=A0A368UL48_9GAMM|nr:MULTISPECIES: hypothetical protein [Pseudidiomarina]MDX1525715.1 hypothetical protein [Pseudidiomarina maritima]PWW09727.1 hypothetical protein DET45_11848 [Pseudidiomarina maritima]RBP87443.1 hypothetical protein DFO81_12048 [Pseudidiomarina tainanensis]RCW29498.1 hypothetical protein DFO79_11948 [Pseudidiomarina tainanensis]
MNSNLGTKLVAIAAVTLLAAGCGSTTQNGYQGAHPVQRTTTNEMNTIVFIDHQLNRTDITKTIFGERVQDTVKVTLDRSGISNSATGQLEVWTMIRNRTDYDLQIEGKALFFDANQAPLMDETMWRRVYVPANGTAIYKETSLNDRAAYFLVELREGR